MINRWRQSFARIKDYRVRFSARRLIRAYDNWGAKWEALDMETASREEWDAYSAAAQGVDRAIADLRRALDG